MTNVAIPASHVSLGGSSNNAGLADSGAIYSLAGPENKQEALVNEGFTNSAQFNALSEKEKAAQVARMSPAQVAKLIDILPDKYIGMLKPSQVSGLTPLQVKAGFSPLSWEALSGLSIEQRRYLTPDQNWRIEKNRTSGAMMEDRLRELSPAIVALCISGMSGSEIKLLKPAQLSLLTPEQVKENFSPLPWEALAGLDSIQRSKLTAEQNLRIEENRYPGGLTKQRLQNMDVPIVALCLAAMSPDQFYALAPGKVTIRQLLALPDKQAKALTGYDSEDLASMVNGRLEHDEDITPGDVDPDEAITGFTQGMVGNCVAISSIKAAMVKYGEDPADVFKDVQMDEQGWKITMRDGCQLTLSFAEFRMASERSDFERLKSKSMSKSANFMYAAMAKRACMTGNDGKTSMSYEEALDSFDGEYPEEGLKWLGIDYRIIDKAKVPYVEAAVVSEYIPGHSAGHSMFSGGGKKDRYGTDDGTNAKDLVFLQYALEIV